MSIRIQSERWVSHIVTILNGEQDHLFSQKNNDETFQYVLGCLKTLLANTKLSEKQKNLLINNIKLRVPGKQNFVFSGDIFLTRKQICDAKKREDIQCFLKAIKIERTALSIMTEAMEEKLAELDFADPEILARFRAHISAFDPKDTSDDQSVTGVTE